MKIKLLCAIAGVSKSGYYKWLKQADDPDKDLDDYLLIKEIFDQGKGKYGFRNIQMSLMEKNINMNHKKIIRIMRKYCLFACIRKVNPYRRIMKKTLEHRIFANLLNRNFRPEAPSRVFCTDITYLAYNKRMAYLSVIKDIATGEIVSWNLAGGLTVPLVIKTVRNLMNNKNLSESSLKNVMIHSDQGFHYTHPDYIKVIRDLGMIQSMSRKGNCIDNAPIESFFGHFKDEVDYRSCTSFEDLTSMVADYMDYYNNNRCQWDLKKMAPANYRNYLLETCV